MQNVIKSMGSKTVLIGGDSQENIEHLSRYIQEQFNDKLEITSTGSIAELYNTITRGEPPLIILNFKFNNLVVQDLCNIFDIRNSCLLCISDFPQENSAINHSSHVIFEETFIKVSKGCFLKNLLNTIYKVSSMKRDNNAVTAAENMSESAERQFDQSLARYSLELDHKVDTLLKVKQKIVGQYEHVSDATRKELYSIVNSIQSSIKDNRHWQDFKVYFEQICPSFISFLTENYPALTTTDIKYCCYLKMNMSNSDISHLLGINQQSVSMHKYRLKLKMVLPKDTDLRSFVQTLKKAS